jgi:LmbE family N-acetylglucosaminyl deacetylase
VGKRTLTTVFLAAVTAAAVAIPLASQPRGPAPDSGREALAIALRQLGNVGTFLQTTAHPDDESSALLAMLDRGLGYRTTLLTATRGTGGQNEIGPELFEALSVLRTSELEQVHRFDGTEQYFGRQIDFGYSFSVDETFEKWGRDEVLSDYVRMIRTLRPDVILTMRPDGEGGGEHHQAQARITGEAFRAAADPARFPEQVREGLRPWQARKLYYTGSYGFRGEPPPPAGVTLLPVVTDVYDPALGATYAEVGGEARSYHKCQGMGQLLPLPGAQTSRYRLGDTSLPGGPYRKDVSLFDGIDTTLPGLVQYLGASPPDMLSSALAAIAGRADEARRAFDAGGMDAAVAPLAAGLAAIRQLRGGITNLGLDPAGAFEIDLRLAQEEGEFQEAILIAQALRVDLIADDGLVVPGQPVNVQAIVANRGASPVRVQGVTLSGFDGQSSCPTEELKPAAIYRCTSGVGIPAAARLTTPYWQPIPGTARYEFDSRVPFGLPFAPTPFRARLALSIAGTLVSADLPVRFRYEGNIFSGEKRAELLVVPRYSVVLTPDIAIVPTAAASAAAATRPTAGAGAAGKAAATRELRVAVTNGTRGAAKATVSLEAPEGWTVEPISSPVDFAREDETETVRFLVTPPARVRAGDYTVRARVRDNGERFSAGYQVIEYPHISRRHRIVEAETTIKAIDVKVKPGLRVGYVMGVGDQVPLAIEQLGVRLTLLGADDLAWGDLSRFDAIVTGVRAYERRADLRANNRRLLQYVQAGGTLIVQYNKFEFNEAQYAPYPVKVSSNRVTGEEAPVRVLVPRHPVFNAPNRIGDDAWKGWVQERGLYFLGPDKDPRYVDLVSLEDPFPHNPGVKTGALVEARSGKGRWIYVGLGLWRQLPAGTPGAYQLLANLLSNGR